MRPVVEIDYRSHATAGARRGAAWAATAYDWLLRQVADPIFTWRLTFLDACERHRLSRAQKAGDVFEEAWLAAHYRNERHRVAEHWTQLHKGRDPLQKWGDGSGQQVDAMVPDRVASRHRTGTPRRSRVAPPPSSTRHPVELCGPAELSFPARPHRV